MISPHNPGCLDMLYHYGTPVYLFYFNTAKFSWFYNLEPFLSHRIVEYYGLEGTLNII